MKLVYQTLQTAQERCDKLHADMIAANALYAASAALYDDKHKERGGTKQWCFPEQIGAQWSVAVDDRTIAVLSAQEVTAIGIADEAVPIEDEPIAIGGEPIG